MTNEIQLFEMYSVLFVIMAYIYLLLGFYVLTLNMKAILNRLFFTLCLTLGLWAYSYCMANFATSYEVALYWNRFSVLGWGVMYSVLVHYFLVLTERVNLISKKYLYWILYLPAFVNIFFYGLYTPSARAEHELIHTQAGWINTSGNGIIDWYFYLYYLVFSFTCIIILWKWHRIKTDIRLKRVVILISISFAISLLMGTMTDVIFRLFMQNSRPQIGIVFAIIPITTVFYTVKKYDLMVDQTRNSKVNFNEILTGKTRVIFYKFLLIVYISASFIIVTERFIFKTNFSDIIYTSNVIFFLSINILLIPYLPFSMNVQDRILSLIVAGTVPLTLVRYMTHASSNTIWAAPFLLITIASIFSQRLMIIMTVISAVVSQIWIWLKHPEMEVQVAAPDYFSRIIIVLISAFMVYFISRLYQKRLEENEEQTRLQRLISEISASLISVNIDNLDEKLNWILRQTGTFFCVDRTYLFQSAEELSFTTNTHEWWAEGVAKKHDQIGTRMTVPVAGKDKGIGFLGFDSITKQKVWKESHKEVLQILANVISDAITKVHAEKDINYMAYYDVLTGLSNRVLFKTQIEKAIALAERSKKFIGVLFLDLDCFKAVNDTMGHKAGDQLLIEISKRLSKCVRRYDSVCRFGGDEFLVMFPQIDELEQIKQAGAKLMSVFKEPVSLNGQSFYVTASAGVAIFPVDGDDSEALIKSADLAMYVSKDHGKNQVTYCSPEMKEVIKEKIQLTNDLYGALEREELVLYYQPQVQIESGKIVGLEALIRWKHPERGMISPTSFIPLAEQTGLIHPIGEWVLRTACQQSKLWQDMGVEPVVMAVNLSVEQFRTPQLTEVVANVLKETGLAPEFLELEITEGIAIKEPGYIIPILNKLKEQGVAISIDDFGTEYSSLSRLKELPIDRIKMAMEFVQGIDKGKKDEAIAMVIINLAKSLGLRVIAEGVETREQLDFLTKGVCDEVQGYYFYRPMPVEEIEKKIFGCCDKQTNIAMKM